MQDRWQPQNISTMLHNIVLTQKVKNSKKDMTIWKKQMFKPWDYQGNTGVLSSVQQTEKWTPLGCDEVRRLAAGRRWEPVEPSRQLWSFPVYWESWASSRYRSIHRLDLLDDCWAGPVNLRHYDLRLMTLRLYLKVNDVRMQMCFIKLDLYDEIPQGKLKCGGIHAK